MIEIQAAYSIKKVHYSRNSNRKCNIVHNLMKDEESAAHAIAVCKKGDTNLYRVDRALVCLSFRIKSLFRNRWAEKQVNHLDRRPPPAGGDIFAGGLDMTAWTGATCMLTIDALKYAEPSKSLRRRGCMP